MYELEKQQLIDCARDMMANNLVVLSGGNVSCRISDEVFLVTPSAMRYENMVQEDIVVINAKGEILEGNRRPSSDLKALLYIYNQRREVTAIIHTHQPYATAVGLITDCLPACLTSIIDTANDNVCIAPFTVSSDEGMGILTVEYLGASKAVILSNHGVVCIGGSLEDVLETAVYLEEGSKAYLAASAAGTVKLLSKEQIMLEMEDRGNYGQF